MPVERKLIPSKIPIRTNENDDIPLMTIIPKKILMNPENNTHPQESLGFISNANTR